MKKLYYRFGVFIKDRFPSIYNLIKKYPLRFVRNLGLKNTDFPSQIWLENTNHCNAECIMCPRESHTRKKGIMKFELYVKLIKEISTYRNTLQRLHMHNFGEPLLDKKLPERIKLAKNHGIKHVYFVTNASLLNEESSFRLISSGLDEMKISFYGTEEASYNRVMKGLDFQETLDNVKKFFKIRREMKSSTPKVVIQLIPQLLDESEDDDKWADIFDSVIDKKIGDKLNIFNIHNYGSGRDYVDLKGNDIRNVCNYPWSTLIVLQNGDVSPCSGDYNGELKLGSVNKNTIFEIWNSEIYKKIRKDFKNLNYDDYAVCKNCIIPYG